MDDKSLGIYAVKDKKFYYLESGLIPVTNTITRLRRILIQRRVIDFDERYGMDTSDYKIMSCKDAKLQDLDMTPIYISAHVKNSVTSKQAEEEKEKSSGIWGDE